MRVDVQGTAIQALLGLLLVLNWLEQEDWHRHYQLHGVGLAQAPLLEIPSSTLQEHSLHFNLVLNDMEAEY